MAKAGDSYVVTLKKTHLNWGTHRYTGTRGDVLGEGYIPIPISEAHRIGLFNSNGTYGADEMGKNIFRYSSDDGFVKGILRAQGCNSAGEIYAKQFSEDGDLKAIGSWFVHIGAIEGTKIKVSWTSPTDVVLSAASGSATFVNNTQTNQEHASPAEIVPPKIRVNVCEGDTVVHKIWGPVVVNRLEKDRIYVQYGDKEKPFVFPDAFEQGFLKTKD